MHETLKAVLRNLKKKIFTAFIDLVTTEQSCDYVVKMTKEKDIVPKHTSFQIDCQVQAQQLKKDITLVFELDMNPHRAEGLEFCETLVKLRSGALPYIVLDVQNPIDHHIELLGRTVVGTSQQVQVVLLLSSRNPVISLSDSESSQCRECASC